MSREDGKCFSPEDSSSGTPPHSLSSASQNAEVAMMRRVCLYCLFFLSGASALIYEIAWQRSLNLIFGVGTLSVSAVLAAFMGGLAFGGMLSGRWADRARHPLRVYALLEAGIAIAGLLVPF